MNDIWEWINKNILFGDSQWVLQVFLVVFTVLFVNYVVRRSLDRILRRLEKTKSIWDETLVVVIKQPLNMAIWLVGLAFAADIVQEKTNAPIFKAVDPIRDLGIVVIITWFLVRLISTLQENIVHQRNKEGNPVDLTTADAVGKLLRASVIITGILVALQTLGISISGILAFGGIGGIAVGFAAKDLLANFFGGLMVYLDRPFAVGDWIRSPDKQIEGTVEEIGWRQTRIRTFDKRPIYVPNATFTTIVVENPSRMTHRRIYETIGIRYEDAAKMSLVVEDIKKMLKAHDEIDQTQTMIVNFNSFNESSLDFFVYTFTKTTNWIRYHEVKHDVLLKIYEIIEGHGADIAYPTRTLHMASDLPEEMAPNN